MVRYRSFIAVLVAATFPLPSQIEFKGDTFPLIRAAQLGQVLELPDCARQELVPPALMQRWEIASLLGAPIARRRPGA